MFNTLREMLERRIHGEETQRQRRQREIAAAIRAARGEVKPSPIVTTLVVPSEEELDRWAGEGGAL